MFQEMACRLSRYISPLLCRTLDEENAWTRGASARTCTNSTAIYAQAFLLPHYLAGIYKVLLKHGSQEKDERGGGVGCRLLYSFAILLPRTKRRGYHAERKASKH